MPLDLGELKLQAALEEFLEGEESQLVEVLRTFPPVGRQRLVEAVTASIVEDLRDSEERARSAEAGWSARGRTSEPESLGPRPGKRKAPVPQRGRRETRQRGRKGGPVGWTRRPQVRETARPRPKGRAASRQPGRRARARTASQSRPRSASQAPPPWDVFPGAWGGAVPGVGRQSRGVWRCVVACPDCGQMPCNRRVEHSFDGHDEHRCKGCLEAALAAGR